MHVLVTGGHGFIGSHLVQALLAQGHSVTTLDNRSRRAGIPLDPAHPGLTVVSGCLTDRDQVERAVQEAERVYHLAAISQVMTAVEDPDTCFAYNVTGTHHVVSACVRHEKKLIFASSREVYGDCRDLPVSESAPYRPKNPYAGSKVAGEALIHAAHGAYGLDYAILRLGNVIGAGDSGRVLPLFAGRAAKGEPLILYGGHQILDLVDVNDVVAAFLKAPAKRAITVNVASGRSVPLTELAALVAQEADRPLEIEIRPPRAAEVERFTADVTLARLELGWEPATPLRQSVQAVLNALR